MLHSEQWMPAMGRTVDLAAHGLSHLGYRVLPRAIADWREVEVQRNIPYRDTGSRDHFLDIYRRRDTRRSLPTVLYIHGGAFSMMSKDTHQVMAYVLAARGYQVFNINYRLAPAHSYPKPLEDAAAALGWVLDHGAEYGADLDRLAIMGESAGANLTAALAYCATHPRPEPFAREVFDRAPKFRCVAPIYGALDLEDMERFWRDPRKARRLAWWIKGILRTTASSYLGSNLEGSVSCPLASPLRLFEESPTDGSRPLPPFFATVGTADPLLSDTVRLREALQTRGTECELHVFRGEIHAFNVMLWRKAAREHWRALFGFLGRHMQPDVMPRPSKWSEASRYVSLAQFLAE